MKFDWSRVRGDPTTIRWIADEYMDSTNQLDSYQGILSKDDLKSFNRDLSDTDINTAMQMLCDMGYATKVLIDGHGLGGYIPAWKRTAKKGYTNTYQAVKAYRMIHGNYPG